MCPNTSSLVLSDQSTDFQNSSSPFQCSQANLSQAVMCCSSSKGVLLGWWPWSPPRWRALATVFLETPTPEEARSTTIILADVRGFLLTSLTIFLSRVLVILRLRPHSGLILTIFVSLYLAMIQPTAVLDTEMLGNCIPHYHDPPLFFLSSRRISFVFGMVSKGSPSQ